VQHGGEPDAGAEMLGEGRGHRQEFGPAVGQPLLGSGGLTLRAVPVAAGVVADAQVGAGLSAFDMTRPTPPRDEPVG
jgi:hypothetical protein